MTNKPEIARMPSSFAIPSAVVAEWISGNASNKCHGRRGKAGPLEPAADPGGRASLIARQLPAAPRSG